MFDETKPQSPHLIYGAIPLLIVVMFAVPIYAHSVMEVRLIALKALILIASGFSLIVALGAVVDIAKKRPPNVNRTLMLAVATFGNMTLFVAVTKLNDASLI